MFTDPEAVAAGKAAETAVTNFFSSLNVTSGAVTTSGVLGPLGTLVATLVKSDNKDSEAVAKTKAALKAVV